MSRLWNYLKGFVEEGQPQSSARLCAILSTVSACGVGWYGAVTHWDSSMIVLALGGGAGASLAFRKAGQPKPDEKL